MSYNIDILQYSFDEIVQIFSSKYNKKIYHAKAFFKALYKNCLQDDLLLNPCFVAVPNLVSSLKNDYSFVLPKITNLNSDDDNIKFRLDYADNLFSESVIIKMKNYYTLCVSSQTGCAHACAFCTTGSMGFVKNLQTKHIIAQYMVAKFILKKDIKNIVFMGMGEALDNFDNVIKAIDLLVHPYGISLPSENITISTVGSVENITKLHKLIEDDLERAKTPISGLVMPTPYRNIKLAVSLNASNNATRDQLMKINLQYNMQNLKEALQKIPLKRKYHDLFVEYVLIPNYNASMEHARELLEFLKDLPCVVNLIPYNASKNSTFLEPTIDEIEDFFKFLVNGGQVVRKRSSKGNKILAACGQLGKE